MSHMRFAVQAAVFGMIFGAAGTVVSQDYPNKPVRILAGSPGSATDFGARLIGQGIAAPLNQPVVIDNRGGNLSAILLSKAPPDGYTVFYTSNVILWAPLMQKLPYDPLTDFAPISLLVGAPQLLVVSPTLPVKSVKELVALAKSKPGELNYIAGNTGGASHLSGELFKSLTGANIVRVSYKGSTASILGDLISGQVHIMFESPAVMLPQIKAGKVRVLAVTSPQPTALIPGLPTVAATVPGFEMLTVGAMYAPAKTPAAIIRRLNQESVRVVQQPVVVDKFSAIGANVVGSSPEELAVWMKTSYARMGKVVQDAGIHLE